MLIRAIFFHGDNPFKPPPSVTTRSIISDIHAGCCFEKSHWEEVNDPIRDVLLLTPLYIDKTTLDKFGRHSIEPVFVTFGIYSAETRQKLEAWRPIGYPYTNFIPDNAGGDDDDDDDDVNEQIEDNDKEQEDNSQFISDSCKKRQDYHHIFGVILARLIAIQKRGGFLWKNFCYKGRVYDVFFKVVTPFIIGDNNGCDPLCGHYISRSLKVQQLLK